MNDKLKKSGKQHLTKREIVEQALDIAAIQMTMDTMNPPFGIDGYAERRLRIDNRIGA